MLIDRSYQKNKKIASFFKKRTINIVSQLFYAEDFFESLDFTEDS